MNLPVKIFTEQNIMHHVVDSYVTCVHGDPSQHIRGNAVLDQVRTGASAMAFAKTSADMRIKSIKPSGWAPHKINSEPFAHLHQNKDKVINIHDRRNCRWGSTLPELKNLEESTYLSRKGTNFVHACDDMGIEVRFRRLYYNWLGLDFGHDARPPTSTRNGMGSKFLNPWKGERRSTGLPPGTRLIRLRAASWVHFIHAFDWEAKWHEKVANHDAEDMAKAADAVAAKVQQSYFVP